MEPAFDHEKLRAYQEALKFAGWVALLIEKLPPKLAALECAACLDVLYVRSKISAEDASAGKALLVTVVSLVSGLISRFLPSPNANTGSVREDSATYLSREGADYAED